MTRVDALARPMFVAEIEQFGGAERSLLALSRWLFQQGLPNYLLTYHDACNIAQYATGPLPVVELKPARGARAKIAALKSHCEARQPGAPAILCSGYQPALHGTLAGMRSFHTLMHDTPSLFGDSGNRSLQGKLRIAVSNRIIGYGLRSGGRTLVNSEYLKAECRKDFGVEADIVRMGGLQNESQRGTVERKKLGRLCMLSVCRVEANKRIDWLLLALAALEANAVAPLSKPLSQLTDWRLDLAGKGSRIAELTALAASLGLSERVHFHGFVPDDALEQMYGEADLFLMPALQGYGIPALEALDRGIPVLLHRESGVSDVLLNTPWATVMHGSEKQTAEALARAVNNQLCGLHLGVARPQLPSEDEWAAEVARLCAWL